MSGIPADPHGTAGRLLRLIIPRTQGIEKLGAGGLPPATGRRRDALRVLGARKCVVCVCRDGQ